MGSFLEVKDLTTGCLTNPPLRAPALLLYIVPTPILFLAIVPAVTTGGILGMTLAGIIVRSFGVGRADELALSLAAGAEEGMTAPALPRRDPSEHPFSDCNLRPGGGTIPFELRTLRRVSCLWTHNAMTIGVNGRTAD